MIMSPALIMIFGAMLIPFVPRTARAGFILLLPLLTLYGIWQVPAEGEIFHFAGFQLKPLHQHDFTLIFATVFAIAAFAGGLFGLRQMRDSEIVSAYIYAGSAIGVTFAGDLVSLFFFWEAMAVASTIIIWCGRMENSGAAGLRYAYMHFTAGAILLSGIAAYYIAYETVDIQPLKVEFFDLLSLAEMDLKSIAAWLILMGFLVNVAAPPFSAWLPDAYPESSPFGAVFLSAFTTKTAVFTLLTMFAGNSLLIYIGLFMVFYGIIYALLENDMRRILAYSIVNQVGFMVTGIGIGTALSTYGAAAHAFCHIIYKALLLMSAGSVLYMTGKRKCSELGGLHHTMKYTMWCGIIGALSISAFPLTSGFISKSLISSAAVEQHLAIVWYLLAAASAGVFLHAGIKFPWFVFFQKDSGLRPKDPPFNMKAGMILLSAGCLLPGVAPELVYSLLPANDAFAYQPYTISHVLTQLQLLLFAGLAFFVMLPWLKRTETISLDFDWIYRVFLKGALIILRKASDSVLLFSKKSWGFIWHGVYGVIYEWHGPKGRLAGIWGVGTTAFFAVILLGIILILYYIGNG